MYRVNGPLHTWLSSTNIKPNKASPPSLHTAAAAGRRHRSLLILSVDSLWKPVVRAAERLPASCDCVSPEHSSSLYSDTADSFSLLASSRFDNGGNCSCLYRSDRKWILTLQADDQVCRSVCVCSSKALIMCVFITFTCLHMISVELCHESSRTVLMNSLCPPLRACFVLLHSLKRSRRRAMSSLRLLALRWSMTTPYWCTLAPFRSLPAPWTPQLMTKVCATLSRRRPEPRASPSPARSLAPPQDVQGCSRGSPALCSGTTWRSWAEATDLEMEKRRRRMKTGSWSTTWVSLLPVKTHFQLKVNW